MLSSLLEKRFSSASRGISRSHINERRDLSQAATAWVQADSDK
jgi:hypothetical protein